MNLKGSKSMNIDVKGRLVFGPTNFTKPQAAPAMRADDIAQITQEWKVFITALIYIVNYSLDPGAVQYAQDALSQSAAYRKLVEEQAQEEEREHQQTDSESDEA